MLHAQFASGVVVRRVWCSLFEAAQWLCCGNRLHGPFPLAPEPPLGFMNELSPEALRLPAAHPQVTPLRA